MSNMPPRDFTLKEDEMIRQAHAGEIKMIDLARALRASLKTIYRRMEQIDLPRRRPDNRSQWKKFS